MAPSSPAAHGKTVLLNGVIARIMKSVSNPYDLAPQRNDNTLIVSGRWSITRIVHIKESGARPHYKCFKETIVYMHSVV